LTKILNIAEIAKERPSYPRISTSRFGSRQSLLSGFAKTTGMFVDDVLPRAAAG